MVGKSFGILCLFPFGVLDKSVHSYWKLTIRNGGQLGNGQRGSASRIKTGYLTRVYLVSWINGFEMKGDHSR